MNCINCDFSIKIGSKFCGSCGIKVEPINSCSECNTINDIGNKFCGSCGNNLIKNLKTITTVKIGAENNSDIIQSLYNKDIPQTNNSLFSFKKWFDNKYPIAPQEFEELYNNNQIDLDEISQIREFWKSVDTNAKMEIIKIWENNLNLKNKAVKIDIENSLDIKQSPENKAIPNNDDVPFSFKKLSVILIGVLGRWILIIIIIPSVFFILNFSILGKLTGAITGFGGLFSLNLIVFGFANRNIASNSNRNTTNAFWLGFLGALGLVICLFNSVKLVQKKILLGILRFLIFAIAMQLLGELGIISNGGKGLLLYFFGFTFILRGVNMFNYSVKKKMLF